MILVKYSFIISGAQRVRYIWPRRGSINGGTHVTIVGSGESWTLINFATLKTRLKTNSVFFPQITIYSYAMKVNIFLNIFLFF